MSILNEISNKPIGELKVTSIPDGTYDATLTRVIEGSKPDNTLDSNKIHYEFQLNAPNQHADGSFVDLTPEEIAQFELDSGKTISEQFVRRFVTDKTVIEFCQELVAAGIDPSKTAEEALKSLEESFLNKKFIIVVRTSLFNGRNFTMVDRIVTIAG